MKVLVINAGSSSLKYRLFEMDNEQVLAKGVADRIGIGNSFLKHTGKKEAVIEKNLPNHEVAIKEVLEVLTDPEYGVIKSADEISAVGHRVVAGGEYFTESALVTDETREKIRDIIELAPLHMPACLMGIDACRKVMHDVPHVLVFDTSFHSTMPDVAKLYGIDYDDYKELKIRRYGAHGISHQYVSEEAAKIYGKKEFNLIVCHLGNGASLSAVKNGKCVDTSMGFTPLEGLIMGTRSGDIDPSVVQYLTHKKGWDVSQAISYLNKSCGVKGISGVSSDFRDLTAAAAAGNKRAELAIDMFAYRVKKYIGSYAAAMDGVDMIAFTAGIGENTPEVRERVLSDMSYLGLKYDNKLNYACPRGEAVKLSTDDSKVLVYVIPTNEELVIARETLRLASE
ncbi:MAG TPA: acetate kinase [Candidatus Protoclostridium stercorigallinarum]|uniref:Acetate kinase n=1 Tax=Candidatus Protoclostridium stercorigallinarum TaxID=2838741 RepID=A0A9D1Q2F0_9FIRM|nr:acetate kinase [Candidatus Protoclostridium stercorigallinarum]